MSQIVEEVRVAEGLHELELDDEELSVRSAFGFGVDPFELDGNGFAKLVCGPGVELLWRFGHAERWKSRACCRVEYVRTSWFKAVKRAFNRHNLWWQFALPPAIPFVGTAKRDV